jgi:hypothetical protein
VRERTRATREDSQERRLRRAFEVYWSGDDTRANGDAAQDLLKPGFKSFACGEHGDGKKVLEDRRRRELVVE